MQQLTSICELENATRVISVGRSVLGRSPPQPRSDTVFSDFLHCRDLLRPIFGHNTGMSSIFESRLAVRCQSQDCQVSHLKHNSSSCCWGNLSRYVHNISFHKKETTPAALQSRDAPASDSRQIEEHLQLH